jgi:hypothetical protein
MRRSHLAIAAVTLLAEVGIARNFAAGTFVRSSLGDVLAVFLLYFAVRGVSARARPRLALALSVGTGVAIELLQGVHFADRLGLRRGSLLSIALGNTFSVSDLLMYVIGGLVAVAVDVGLLGAGPDGPRARGQTP